MVNNRYNWIFDVVENINGYKPECFLLKKDPRGRYFHSFKLQPTKTNFFKSKIITKIEDTKIKFENKEIRIINNIHEEKTDTLVINILDVTKYDFVQKTIKCVFETADANKSEDLRSMEGVKFSALLFKIPGEKSVIALDSVSVFNEAFKKIGLIAIYDNEGIEKLDKSKSILTFELGLPCIYFEETKKLVVFDIFKTENMFNLKEYYKEKAKAKFKKLIDENIIDITDEILEKEINSITTVRRINTMIEEGVFTTDIKIYKNMKIILKNIQKLMMK